MTKHSKVGASSMYRWSACPGSVRLCETVPKAIVSKYAKEGTQAHEVAEAIIRQKIWPSTRHKFQPKDLPDDMLEAVQVYVDYVTANAKNADIIKIEHRFKMPDYHKDCFGTSDTVLYWKKEGLLEVIDYKHGAGVLVEATQNSQLKYYGLGTLSSLKLPVKVVKLTIVQPRCPHPDGVIRSEYLEPLELINFGVDLIEAIQRTEHPNAPLKAGDHCRFCPAAGICPEIQNKAQEMAKSDFTPVELAIDDRHYEPLTLAKNLSWLPALESWIKAVREFAYSEAMAGRTPPGFKLVQKRARREWISPAETIESLRLIQGLSPMEMFEDPKLKSPAQMEKLFKSKKDKESMAPLIQKKSSGCTLVPESDKRPVVINSAKDDFTVIEEKGE